VGAIAITPGHVKFWVGSLRSPWKKALKRHIVGLKINSGKLVEFLDE
jgi:hypothetical protein